MSVTKFCLDGDRLHFASSLFEVLVIVAIEQSEITMPNDPWELRPY
jgi:hypothetical protein